MPTGHRDVLVHVGDNLRRLRQAAGRSQATLAEAAGISRRTIINLEAGEANISLSGLDRLAAALGVTFVDLVSPPAAPTRRIDALVWRGAAPESTAVLLGSAPARSEAQLWAWALAVGDRYDAEPDPPGWHEMVLVTEGRLLLERDEGPTTLSPGDHAIYASSQSYAYVNVHDGVTRFVRAVVS
jgi:transcriptional regulator with XRE-family HTH domain